MNIFRGLLYILLDILKGAGWLALLSLVLFALLWVTTNFIEYLIIAGLVMICWVIGKGMSE